MRDRENMSTTYVESTNSSHPTDMSTTTKVLWSDSVFNKNCNLYYPVFIHTPNGEYITGISAMNKFVDPLDTDEEPTFSEPDSTQEVPALLVKGFMNEMNVKLIDWSTATLNVKMFDDKGNAFSKKVLDVIDTLTVNGTERTISSFVLLGKLVQNKSPGLNKLYLTVTMSNGDEHKIEMTYLTLGTAKWKAHREQLQRFMGPLYELMSTDSTTDDEIIAKISELDKAFVRNTESVRRAGKSSHSRPSLKRELSEGTYDAPHALETKRSIVHLDSFYPQVMYKDIGESVFYIVLHGDMSNRFYVSDFATNPPLPCDIAYSRSMPQSLYNMPDLYMNRSYSTVMNAAERFAESHGNTILWFTISDVDMFRDSADIRFVLSATIRSETDSSFYGKVAAVNLEFRSEMTLILGGHIITSLDNYSNGKHLQDLTALTPVHVDRDNFTVLGDADLSDIGDMPPMSPMREQVEDFHGEDNLDEELDRIMEDLPSPPNHAVNGVHNEVPYDYPDNVSLASLDFGDFNV